MTTQFQPGTEYYTHSICDHDTVYRHVIIRRTAKTVWTEINGEVKARRIYVTDGVERFQPYGNYSMAAVISADKVWDDTDRLDDHYEELNAQEKADIANDDIVADAECVKVKPYFVEAKFATCNKQDWISDYIRQCEDGDCTIAKARVCFEVSLTPKQWNHFMTSLLDSRHWMLGKGGSSSTFDCGRPVDNIWQMTADEIRQYREQSYDDDCILVKCGHVQVLVNPEGHDYARYVGIDVKAISAKRHLAAV